MPKEVVLYAIRREGYHGDRARAMGARPMPYNDYQIHITEAGHGVSKETLVDQIDGYDLVNSSVHNSRYITHLAFEKAAKLAELVTGSNQFIQEWSMTKAEAIESARKKLSEKELEALGW